MRKNNKRKKRFSAPTRYFDLPEFACGPEEAIEILGRNTIMIEGAKGIHTYEQEVVRVHMKGYLLALFGSGFDLSCFEDGCLRITGQIKGIGWEE